MADTITEVENVVTGLEGVAPALGVLLSAIVPGAALPMTFVVPILSVLNEALQAVETFKAGGTSHEAAVAIVGQAVTAIGQQITRLAPAPVAAAAVSVAAAVTSK
jgi:hypothetical protein